MRIWRFCPYKVIPEIPVKNMTWRHLSTFDRWYSNSTLKVSKRTIYEEKSKRTIYEKKSKKTIYEKKSKRTIYEKRMELMVECDLTQAPS